MPNLHGRRFTGKRKSQRSVSLWSQVVLSKHFASITQQGNPTLPKNVSDKSRCIEDLAPDSLGVFDQSIYSTSNSSPNSKIFLSKKKATSCTDSHHWKIWCPKTKKKCNCPGNQGPGKTRLVRNNQKTIGRLSVLLSTLKLNLVKYPH